MTLIDYLPLLIAPGSGLIIMIVAFVLVFRDKAKQDKQPPAE